MIGEGDTSEGTKRKKDVVGLVEDELHIGATDGLIDRKAEVAEAVARKLTEDTHKDDHEQPPLGAVHLNEVGLGGSNRSPLSSPQQNHLA